MSTTTIPTSANGHPSNTPLGKLGVNTDLSLFGGIILVDVGGAIDNTAAAFKGVVAKAMDPDLHARIKDGATRFAKATALTALAVGASMAATGGVPTKAQPTKLFGYFG